MLMMCFFHKLLECNCAEIVPNIGTAQVSRVLVVPSCVMGKTAHSVVALGFCVATICTVSTFFFYSPFLVYTLTNQTFFLYHSRPDSVSFFLPQKQKNKTDATRWRREPSW